MNDSTEEVESTGIHFQEGKLGIKEGSVQIWKGIPLPSPRECRESDLTRAIRLMEVGDCIEISESKILTLHALKKRTGVKLARRKQVRNGKNIYRIWRTA